MLNVNYTLTKKSFKFQNGKKKEPHDKLTNLKPWVMIRT